MSRPRRSAQALSLLALITLAGCSNFLSADGPGLTAVTKQASVTSGGSAPPIPYSLVYVNSLTLKDLSLAPKQARFDIANDPAAEDGLIGIGDDLGVTVFEAGSGGLFITDPVESRNGNSVTLPTCQVDESGNISIPYGGTVRAAGRTPTALEQAIAGRLAARALEPQVVVTILARRSGMVSVIGDVVGSAHFSLDPGGETILGALARAGGMRFPDYETTITLQRGGITYKARLSEIVRDPSEDLKLRPGDAIFVAHQPDYFLAMGATGQTSSLGLLDRRIAFGSESITLSDALARAGGLEDDRANAHALLVFRLNHTTALPGTAPMPTVYIDDLRDPRGYLYASQFRMHPEDLIFVSNAPAADVAKFLNLILPVAYSAQGFNAGFR